MVALESLVNEARALATGEDSYAPEKEVARQLAICNACRYCEGFCAVFPAMTRRLECAQVDVQYLANLCHNCGACLHACQYAPPHEFAVNVPKAMAEVRRETYITYAWPRPLGALYKRNGLLLSLMLAAALSLFLVLALAFNGTLWGGDLQGDFYRLFPHNLLVAMFLPVFAWAVLALGVGVTRFLRDVGPFTSAQAATAGDLSGAAQDALTLKYLDGGHGDGCHNEDDAYTLSRRRAHHLTFYGFMLCFAATTLGTVYHYVFGWVAPYDLPSLPKVLGAVGGLMLLWGTAALFVLKWRRHPLHGDAAQAPMDYGFIALLFLTSLTGLLLWWLRGTDALALMLAVHLGVVMALFATLPYGKFAHGVFRSAALLRWAVERRQPSPIGIGDD